MGNNKNDSYLEDDLQTLDLLKEKYPDVVKKDTKKKLFVLGGFLGVGYLVYPHPFISAANIIVSIIKGMIE